MSPKTVALTVIMTFLVALPLILMRRRPRLQRVYWKDNALVKDQIRYDIDDFLG